MDLLAITCLIHTHTHTHTHIYIYILKSDKQNQYIFIDRSDIIHTMKGVYTKSDPNASNTTRMTHIAAVGIGTNVFAPKTEIAPLMKNS
jgi:hypothetical protein